MSLHIVHAITNSNASQHVQSVVTTSEYCQAAVKENEIGFGGYYWAENPNPL